MAQDQAYIFLVFSLTGIVIGFLFDFFRILRRSIKTPNIITNIEDMLFWILSGILILYNIWYFNSGEIRIYIFFAIILGILVYMSVLSSAIIQIFSKVLQIIIKIVELPIKKIITIIRTLITKISTIFIKNLKKVKIKKGNFGKNGE